MCGAPGTALAHEYAVSILNMHEPIKMARPIACPEVAGICRAASWDGWAPPGLPRSAIRNSGPGAPGPSRSGGLLRKEAGHCPGEIMGPRQSRKSRLATGRGTEVLGDSGSRRLNVRKSYPLPEYFRNQIGGGGGRAGIPRDSPMRAE